MASLVENSSFSSVADKLLIGEESLETIHAPSVRPFPKLSSVKHAYLGLCRLVLHSLQLAKVMLIATTRLLKQAACHVVQHL